MNSPPAFQFYAADWLADADVTMMTLEEEGAYIRALAFCWREGSIPADEKRLSVLLKGGSREVLAAVKQRFKISPSDSQRLVHGRLDLERKKQKEWREKSSEAGKKSGKIRREKKLHTEPTLNSGSDLVEPKANSSSSSSSSSTTTDKEPELTLLSPTAPKKEIRPEEFANVWNRLRGKLPKVERFTESRKKKVKTRMNEGLTLERFAEAVENCTTKPFLRGDNDDGWTATFDWLVENDKNLEKAINNPYGSNKPNGGNHNAAVPTGKTDHGMAICAELIAEDQYRSRAVQNGGVQASEAKQDGRATLFLDSGAVGHESVSSGNGYSF